MLLFLGISIMACSSDDEKKENCITQQEVNQFQSKVDAFTANPSPTTCSALKEAAFVYLEKLEKCPGASEATKALVEQWYEMDCSALHE